MVICEAEIELTFVDPGPLGIIWHKIKQGKSEIPILKEIKPGSAAAACDGADKLTEGMQLCWINSIWIMGLDYFDIISEIREQRPITLGFCSPISPFSPAGAAKANYSVPKAVRSQPKPLAPPLELQPSPDVKEQKDEAVASSVLESPGRLTKSDEKIEEADEEEDELDVSPEDKSPTVPDQASSTQATSPASTTEPDQSRVPKTMKKPGAARPRGRNASVAAMTSSGNWIQPTLDKGAAEAVRKAKAAADAPRFQGEPEPVDFSATFEIPGAIGIVWKQDSDELGREVAVIKAIRSNTPAGNQSASIPGMMHGCILGYVNGEWVKGLDYFTVIKKIRQERPLELRFCDRMPGESPRVAESGRASPEHQFGGDVVQQKTKVVGSPRAKAPPRRIRAQSVAVGAAQSKMLASEMAAAAAEADKTREAGLASVHDPPDFETVFAEPGPLGIVWSSTLNGVELGYAYIKS
eukprot:SAG31_NODE_7229_length_1749_cov_1.341212_1_plen_466_part_10